MSMPIVDIPRGVSPEYASAAAFQQQQERLRNQVAAAVLAMWAASSALGAFGPIDAAQFAARLMPVAVGAQRTMAALTMARLNQITHPRKPIDIPLEVVTGPSLRGKDPADYYQRPFREVLWKLSEGKALDKALEAGSRRAQSLVQTDVQLAHTKTAQRFLAALDEQLDQQKELERTGGLVPTEPRKDSGRMVVGYRRVLSSRPNHCALCILASTQKYRKADLMPIHPGCGCTVMPVFEYEPHADEHVLDPDLVREIHRAVRRDLGEKYVDSGGRNGPAMYRDIVVVNRHGELGPVMGVRGQHFERDPNRPGHLGHTRVNPVEEPQAVQDLDHLF